MSACVPVINLIVAFDLEFTISNEVSASVAFVFLLINVSLFKNFKSLLIIKSSLTNALLDTSNVYPPVIVFVLKEGAYKQEDEEAPSPTLIKPSKIGIQKLREMFEEANNRNTITKATYKKYRSVYNNWIKSAGDKDMKKGYLRELQDLYRQSIFVK